KRIAKTLHKTGTGRIEQQERRLDSVAGDDDDSVFLRSHVDIRIKVGDARHETILAHVDARDHAVIANLGSVANSIRHVTDERTLLGTDLAALYTEAPIAAMRAVSMRTRGDGNRATRFDRDAQPRAALNK